MTQKRVVSYERRQGRLEIDEVSFGAIADIQIEEKGGAWSYTILRVTKADDESFILCLSTEGGGDERGFQIKTMISWAGQK